jgi:tRNA1Val (adenine37-N6)-methyltransferase
MDRPGPRRPLPPGLQAPPLLDGEDLAVLEDRFVLAQARRGFRFGIDAVMLARHVLERPGGALLEVGAGCGVVSILLAGHGWPGPVVALEVQPALADRARRNVAANGLQDRVRVVEGDARDHRALLGPGTFDRIVSNPPFWRLGTGRRNPDPERERARHEVLLDLPALVALAGERLAPGGVATVLYPPERLPEVEAAAAAAGLAVAGVTPLVPRPGAAAELLLLDLAAGGGAAAAPSPARSIPRPGSP